ncbi:hypothetical protein RFN30_31760 [Mesorhizobium sp. VK23D]|nr:hypothetical protein [Mesorhizobium sp. VK23D]MDX8522784.1 hypothetical protein [Mesorhizobium sp. VK23D]
MRVAYAVLQAMGFREKTDRINAAMIAGYAQAKLVQPTPPPSEAQQRLDALVARLSQVTSDLTVQKQRKSAVASALAGMTWPGAVRRSPDQGCLISASVRQVAVLLYASFRHKACGMSRIRTARAVRWLNRDE